MGIRRCAVQAVLSLCLLCALLLLWRGAPPAQTAFAERAPVRLPILMYHSILKDGARQGKYVVSPTVLAADLDSLVRRGYQSVSLRQVVDYVQNGTPLPERPVLITFDDGYYNNFVYAYPLLRERNMKAVVSVIGSQTALFTENNQTNPYWSHLRLCDLAQMQDVFEVQNHSFALHEYSERRGVLRKRGESQADYTAMLRQDTEAVQSLLAEGGLPAPYCYTYPFGARSDESAEILRAMGFVCTLGCEERVNTLSGDPDCLYDLGRFNRPAGISSEQFLERVLGT